MLITGAGIGIGRACAETFAALGDHVVLTDVLEEQGRETCAALRAAGGSAEFRKLDVTSTRDADAAVAAVEAARGPLDVIVANAGIAHRMPLATMTDELWHHTLDVDLTGMIRVVRAAAPRMRAAKRGAIVCISSVVGTAYGWNEHVPYTAAKAGVAGLVKGLAIELAADRIRVNGIAPGFIRTAQTLDPVNSVGQAGLDAVAPRIPLGRVGEPRDIADVVAFLVSDSARYLTGQTITVDGGLLVGL
ncbi:MAG: SDR family NAD(P)-dependent oxidoreductase [Steroidobacteraceae bacterium]|nr:SDR family NAD(P)-dependent oxidoreductase [Steroidobacteraceae bacterium]